MNTTFGLDGDMLGVVLDGGHSCECETLGIDGDMCGEDGSQVGVFEEGNEVAFSRFELMGKSEQGKKHTSKSSVISCCWKGSLQMRSLVDFWQ